MVAFSRPKVLENSDLIEKTTFEAAIAVPPFRTRYSRKSKRSCNWHAMSQYDVSAAIKLVDFGQVNGRGTYGEAFSS
jgi:hypothetical protein